MDISSAMPTLADRKAQMLAAPATWVRSEVLDVPSSLNGTADLVYTGKGALPWVMDLKKWAAVVERLLKPGGTLFVFEGHPLNWVWEPEASEFQLRWDGGNYFSAEPRANRDFPASGLKQATSDGAPAPIARERQWTLGEIVTSLVEAGLTLERLAEAPGAILAIISQHPRCHAQHSSPYVFTQDAQAAIKSRGIAENMIIETRI